MKNYKPVRIYPKILETKTRFTKEEKEALTKPGIRWKVYYFFRHPVTNEFVRQKDIYDKLNMDYPLFDDRLAEIKILQQTVSEMLKSGELNPYNKLVKNEYTVISALEFALDKKKPLVAYKTFEGYKIAVKRLKEWLVKNGYEFLPLEKIDKRILNLFFTHIASSPKTSARSSNNYKNSLSSLFTELMKYDYLDRNIILQIDDIKTEPKRDPTYSDKQVNDILEYLRENDKVVLMFIYFVSYLFWRPKENCRLKVKDVNLAERKITAPQTKTKGLKVKLIPDIIYNDLAEYIEGADPEDLLFTPTGPGKWNRQLDSRRAVFTARYRELKKVMGIPTEYTIYSFRHSFITRLYRNILKDHPKELALTLTAEITGHTSKAILGYIHYVDASLPKEYSKYLK